MGDVRAGKGFSRGEEELRLGSERAAEGGRDGASIVTTRISGPRASDQVIKAAAITPANPRSAGIHGESGLTEAVRFEEGGTIRGAVPGLPFRSAS
ncbi:MAG: hypothetical protein D6679_10575 [Candidatus Hydrogenedentota bacterium]|nr:MAG: hypothetical protein D6679_10575 [Candidatus Hydrogenedentota bacterium]